MSTSSIESMLLTPPAVLDEYLSRLDILCQQSEAAYAALLAHRADVQVALIAQVLPKTVVVETV